MTEDLEVKESLEEFAKRSRKIFGPRYFDRQGKEIELMEWSRKCEDHGYRILKQDFINRYFVGTIWLGLNMQIFRDRPIEIFETMIFLNEGENKKDDLLHNYQERYSTEEEAFEGHERALDLVRNELKELESQVVESEKDSQSEDPVPSP